MLERGWKKRRADAAAKRSEWASSWDDERADVRRQRAALAEKARVEAEAVAAAREAEIRTAVTVCPCCAGKGHAPVIKAATLIDAAERYREAGWRPSPATVSLLMQNSFMVDSAGNRVETASAVEHVVEAPQEPARAAKTVRRSVVPPPFLEGAD